jgi:hypothetical protein
LLAVPAAALLAVAVAVAGCSTGHDARVALHPRWQQVSLPVPPGAAGRLAPRDAISCSGTWYVVGAVVGPDGSTRPAAWTSTDGRTWRSLTLVPNDFYSRQAVLYAVGCRDGRIAAIGAKSGGAHGNPRTATWVQQGDGSLHAEHAPFEIFGGPHALGVNRIAGGRAGWLIAGDRSSGAATWTSPDARTFRIVEGRPPLASDATRTTGALDAADDGAGWTVVGRAEVTGRVSPVPDSWTSVDGTHWTRQPVPAGTGGYADLERVVVQGRALLAAGIRGSRFGTWQRVDGRWRVAGGFGRLDRSGSTAPFVSGLATGAPVVLAAVSDGVRFGLWARDRESRWRPVETPTRPLSSGDHQLTVASDGHVALLLADDGAAGRAWLAPLSTVNE